MFATRNKRDPILEIYSFSEENIDRIWFVWSDRIMENGPQGPLGKH